MDRLTVYAPGHWSYYDSYGLIACQLARHLTALGVHVNAVGLGHPVHDSQPQDIRAITDRPIWPTLGGIALGYPTSLEHHSHLYHIGPKVLVTMFESTRLPADWLPVLNSLDAVIVPSTFCAQVFADSGVTVPVHVVPLGVSEVYQYQERDSDRPLTFLAFLDRGARKGGIVALNAFLTAFGESTDVRLILKGRPAKVPLTLTNPNIDVIQADMSEEELYHLYLAADVLLNPNKGEGFGLLSREFAATGGISLATGWGGTADDIDQWGWPLPYTLERADWKGIKRFEGTDLGEWAAPSLQGIVERLWDVWTFAGVYRYHAQKRAENVHKLYSWRAFAEQVLAIYTEVAVGYADRARAA